MANLTYWRKCDQVGWLEFLNQTLYSKKMKEYLVKRSGGLKAKKNLQIALVRVLWPIISALEKIWKKEDLTHRLQIAYKACWHLQMVDAFTGESSFMFI